MASGPTTSTSVRQSLSALPSLAPAERFRQFLESLAPSAVQGWLRHVATDGCSPSFLEFCRQLSTLGYETDVGNLWADLCGAGSVVPLEAIDAPAAAQLLQLSTWCKERFGGLLEAWLALGGPCCGHVSTDEVLEAVLSLGGPEERCRSLLDPWSRNALCAQDFFVLEQDPVRRQELDRRWREACEAPEAVSTSNAQNLLTSLVKGSTALGGRHWTAFRLPEPSESLPLRPPRARSGSRCEPRREPRPTRLPRVEKPKVTELPEVPRRHQPQTRSIYEQRQFQHSRKSRSLPMLKSESAVVPHWGPGPPGRQKPAKRYRVMPLGKDQMLFEHFEKALNRPYGDIRSE
eukprot:s826_g3.t2